MSMQKTTPKKNAWSIRFPDEQTEYKERVQFDDVILHWPLLIQSLFQIHVGLQHTLELQ